MTGVLPGLEGYAGRDLALGQWDSDPVLARAFVRWVDVHGAIVVEPSCGIGNIARAAMGAGAASVLGVEIDVDRARVAEERGVSVLCADAFDPDLPALILRTLGVPRAHVISLGNPPFEGNGALRHAIRALEWSRTCSFIAPLETLAGDRDGLWSSCALKRVSVCAPGRPPFGLGGHGMSEIAFFQIGRPAWGEGEAFGTGKWGMVDRVNWRALGAPEAEATR